MATTEVAKQQQLTPEQQEQLKQIEAQKREAWGKMGVIIYHKELEFQVSAQVSLAKISAIPKTIEDIPAAEANLKEVKADCAKLLAARKEITAKFDAVAQRLMVGEKSFEAPINEYAKAIIVVKKEHEKKEADKKLKEQELKRLRETLVTQLANVDADYKTTITDRISAAYNYALGDGNIQPGEPLIKFLKARLAKLSEEDFTPQRPKPSKVYVTDEELKGILNDVWKVNPKSYLELYETELYNRFKDYDVAHKNKAQAIAIAETEKANALNNISQEKQNNIVAAQLHAVATDFSIEPTGVKALRKAYEIDMEETYENAMTIMAAFLAHKEKCYPKTSTKKWFSFNAESAGKALAKVKSEDNNFAAKGIVFKEVDKL